MIRRIVFLAMILFLFCFCACGNENTPQREEPAPAHRVYPDREGNGGNQTAQEPAEKDPFPEDGRDGRNTGQEETVLNITVGEYTFYGTFENNSSGEAFREWLARGPITVEMRDYGGFEKVGDLGRTLPRNDSKITTQAGDVILYQGNQIVIYYDSNSWSLTRLGRISDTAGLKEKLGTGTVRVTFSME